MPTRSSDIQCSRQLVEAVDSESGAGRLVEVAPRAAADVDGDHPGGERGHYVVVHPVADVGDLRRSEAGLHGDSLEELRARLFDAPARRRADEVDVLADELLGLDRRVADRADDEAGRAQPLERGQRIGIEPVAGKACVRPLDAEDLPDAGVRLPAGGEAAEDAHQRETWNAGRVRGTFPERRLVDERLADVEDDGFHSHVATSSRSSGDVTLSSRRSPGTVLIRPPWASTSEAQSGPSPSAARRSASARKACGVCEATSSARSRVSTTSSRLTRLTVSASGRTGTAPS